MSGHQQNAETETPETADTLTGVNQTTLVTNEAEDFFIEFNNYIRLYFLRYGLFAKHNKDEHLVSPNSKEDQEEELTLPTLEVAPPSLEHFVVGRTALNSGYLYLFDEEDKDLFYEYQLHIDGRARTIYEPVYEEDQRTNNGNLEDHRVSSGEFETKKEFMKDQRLWIGYSQVQWTGEYHREMLDAGPDERKKKGLVRVNCLGFPDGFGQEHVLQQSQVRATFREDQKAADSWCDSILNQINIYETKVKPDIKRDMFVVLPDPIGCAMDIAISVSDELRKHQAFVESLRSGRDPDTIALQLKDEIYPPTYNQVEQEQVAMVTLAQTVYQHIYTNPSMMENYASEYVKTYVQNLGRGDISTVQRDMVQEGVDKKKLEAVLAKEERAEQRQLINNLQQDLALYVFEPYYMDAYHHDLGSDSYNILGSKDTATQIFRGLAINPHDIDRSFDLPDVQSLPMPWLEQLHETLTLTNEYKVYEVLNFELEQDDSIQDNAIEAIDLLNKFSDFVQGTLETYSLRAYSAFNNLLGTRTIVTPVPDIMHEITKRMNTAGRVLDINLQATNGTTTYHWNGVASGEIRTRVPRIEILGDAKRFFDNSSTFNIIKNSIEIFNLGASLIALSNDPSAKNTVATIGAITEVLEANRIIRTEILKRSGIQISQQPLVKGLGVLGTGITAIVSFMNARDSFGEGDVSAGFAHIGAGLSYGLAAGLFFFPLLGFFVGLLLLAGFIFTLLGFAWARSEMQRFLQDSAFGTRGGDFPPKSIGEPWLYNRIIISNRFQYVKYGPSLAAELRNFKDDLAWYMNQVIQASVTTTPREFIDGTHYAGTYQVSIAIGVPIQLSLLESLEIKVIYDILGTNAYGSIPSPNVSAPRLSVGGTEIIVEIALPEDFMRENLYERVDINRFMILFRFNNGANGTFPFPASNGKQYYYSVDQTTVPGLAFIGDSTTKQAELVTLDDYLTDDWMNLHGQINGIRNDSINTSLNQLGLPNL